MGSASQFAYAPRKSLRTIGIIAFILGVAHAWLAAMHWTEHQVNTRAFEFAAAGVLIPLLFAFVIAGRCVARDWNKIGLWFLLFSLIILPLLTHVRLSAA
jgi:hypothetical protein